MNISNYVMLLGGVALFLFGMSLMGDGLKKVAGNKLEVILYKLSGTPLRGIFLGMGVTAVIQSSSATSVMVVGFVNSRTGTLLQSKLVRFLRRLQLTFICLSLLRQMRSGDAIHSLDMIPKWK